MQEHAFGRLESTTNMIKIPELATDVGRPLLPNEMSAVDPEMARALLEATLEQPGRVR
jgi:hypothetical protein